MKKIERQGRKIAATLGMAGIVMGLAGCSGATSKSYSEGPFRAENSDLTIGARPAVQLTRHGLGRSRVPEFSKVVVLPGRGMNIYQIQADVPGHGTIDLISSPPLQNDIPAPNQGDGDSLFKNNDSFKTGGAILLPFANRMTGKSTSGGKVIETWVKGHKISLPANWQGKNPGAARHAMHGLMLGANMDSVDLDASDQYSQVTADWDAGDFHHHWLSKTHVTSQVTLTSEQVLIKVTAQNTGDQILPIGIGWHPYFIIPSGKRDQARLHIPATRRLEVTNYDDVFPTGRSLNVEGTDYDFSASGGRALGKKFFDDCWVNLAREPDGSAVADLIDPDAHYGLRIRVLSSEVSAFQVYAPVDQNFVAIEPQFNWADPYQTQIWKSGQRTGMVELKPGESVTYSVALELFTP